MALFQLNYEQAEQLPPLTLAWVGDGVYELYVRTYLLEKSKNANYLSRAAVDRVNHLVQAHLFAILEPHLSEVERGVVYRGRNTNSRVPKNGDMGAYRRATGVEALVGYLYLSGQNDRLQWLFDHIEPLVKEVGREQSR